MDQLLQLLFVLLDEVLVDTLEDLLVQDLHVLSHGLLHAALKFLFLGLILEVFEFELLDLRTGWPDRQKLRAPKVLVHFHSETLDVFVFDRVNVLNQPLVSLVHFTTLSHNLLIVFLQSQLNERFSSILVVSSQFVQHERPHHVSSQHSEKSPQHHWIGYE